MKIYTVSELSTVQLPYILMRNNSVIDIKNATVKDCVVCNDVLGKVQWRAYNATQLCVAVSSGISELKVKAARCVFTGFLCSKPDSK